VGKKVEEHKHPKGSSKKPLKKLTESQPKPNEFTTGSRAAKPNGIAAKGSRLEAWGIGMQEAAGNKKKRRRG
jgi:hypothetical protein